jgi:transcriptional regulator with XRE-family HTH domain
VLYNLRVAHSEETEGKHIGARVAHWRAQRKLSYRALAGRTRGKVSHGWIQQLEAGDVPRPGVGKVAAIAAALRVPITALLEDVADDGLEDLVSVLEDWGLEPEDAADVRRYAEYRRAQRRAITPSHIDEGDSTQKAGPEPVELRMPAQPPSEYRARVQDAIEDVEDPPDRASG